MEKLILVPYDKYQRLLDAEQCGKGKDSMSNDSKDDFNYRQPPGMRESTADTSRSVRQLKRKKITTRESGTISADQTATTPPSVPRPHTPGMRESTVDTSRNVRQLKKRKITTRESGTISSDQTATTPPSLPRPANPPSTKKKHAAAKKALRWISI